MLVVVLRPLAVGPARLGLEQRACYMGAFSHGSQRSDLFPQTLQRNADLARVAIGKMVDQKIAQRRNANHFAESVSSVGVGRRGAQHVVAPMIRRAHKPVVGNMAANWARVIR